jgi:kumamolisin
MGLRLGAGAVLGVAVRGGPLASPSGAAAHVRRTRTPAATRRIRVALAATTQTSGAMEPVAHGIDASALPGATAFSLTPPNTPESVSFILRERNLSQLEASVEKGVHSYLSVSQFAQTYGQSPAVVEGLQTYLAEFGIESRPDADGVDISATGTAGQFDQALAVTQSEYHVPGRAGRDGVSGVEAQTVHGTTQAPELPAGIAGAVLAILGLTNYSPFTSQAVHVDAAATRTRPGNAKSCVKLSGLPDACNLPTSFDNDYGMGGLTQAGATGAGQTLGIVTLATLDPGAPQWFWKHELKLPKSSRTVTVENIDGGAGVPSDASGSGETDLDVEQSGGVAPGADVIVYQAPNTDGGFADAFFDAASQNVAASVSSSWGESETYVEAAVASGTETPAYEQAFDEAFLELAEQGQSGFLAAGDSGAYDADDDLGSTNLSVDTSADSPFITAGGGTTLPWSGTLTGPGGSATVTVPTQRAWGWDYLWPALAVSQGQSLATAAETNIGGGGGGFSALEPAPSYQQGVSGTSTYQAVPYLTPTDDQNVGGIVEPTAWDFTASPPTVKGHGSGRAVPDLSTNADPYSGYLLYEPSFTAIGQPALEGGWGGTSYVAPQLNGAAAVIDSYLGHRVGFWNPAIYAFADSGSSPFAPDQQPGTGNDNLFYTGTPGAVYNEAIGLGTPDLSALANDFKG